MSECDSYNLSEQLFHEKTVIVISIITNKTTLGNLLSSKIFIVFFFGNYYKNKFYAYVFKAHSG